MVKSERVEQAPHGSTVDPDDVARFERLGAQWWNPRGPMAGLHKMNPVRVGYLRDLFIERFPHADGSARDPQHIRSLEGLNVLDIGCGGGIFLSPLARLGFAMASIDPAPRHVDIAQAHAGCPRLCGDRLFHGAPRRPVCLGHAQPDVEKFCFGHCWR